MATKLKKAPEARKGDAGGPRPAERLPLSGLTIHPVLSKLPLIQPVKLPGTGDTILPPGPPQPILVTKGGVVFAGREHVEVARARGDAFVEAVVVELNEEDQIEAVLANCVARFISLDQLAIVAGLWVRAEVARVNKERAIKAGKARTSKANKASSEATSASELGKKPRARERASQVYKVPEGLVRKAERLIRLDRGLADRVLAGGLSVKEAHGEVTKKASPEGAPPRPATPGTPRVTRPEAEPVKGQADQPGDVETAGPPTREAAEEEVSPEEAPPGDEAADEPAIIRTKDQPRPARHEAAWRTVFLNASQTAQEVANALRRRYPPAFLRELVGLLLAQEEGGVGTSSALTDPSGAAAAPPPAPSPAEACAPLTPAKAPPLDGAPGEDEVDRVCGLLAEKAGGPMPPAWLVGEAELEHAVPLGGHGGARRRDGLARSVSGQGECLRDRAREAGAPDGLTTRRVYAARVRQEGDGGPEAVVVSVRVGLVAPLRPGADLPLGAANGDGNSADGEAPPIRWRKVDAADPAPGLREAAGRLLAGGAPAQPLPAAAADVLQEATKGWRTHYCFGSWRGQAAAADRDGN